MYQLIEHESGWRLGEEHRSLGDFLNALEGMVSFEIISVMRVGPMPDENESSKVHRYQILARVDTKIHPHTIRDAARVPNPSQHW